jgi:hypothetical protein
MDLEPTTFRLVAYCLNHRAAVCPSLIFLIEILGNPELYYN